jgi:hypothetical protein
VISALHFQFATERGGDIIAKATVYRARVGTRPAYPSLAEALAFEDGWHAYRDGIECPQLAPWSTGWISAETHDAKAKAAREMERAA